MGRRRIKVTVSNVLIQINWEVIPGYLSEYGDVEDMTAKSTSGAAHGDYIFTVCLNREGVSGHSTD